MRDLSLGFAPSEAKWTGRSDQLFAGAGAIRTTVATGFADIRRTGLLDRSTALESRTLCLRHLQRRAFLKTTTAGLSAAGCSTASWGESANEFLLSGHIVFRRIRDLSRREVQTALSTAAALCPMCVRLTLSARLLDMRSGSPRTTFNRQSGSGVS